jgi:four helix bundle protein
MKDKLHEIRFYQLAKELWKKFWEDSEVLLKDIRGREIARQMTKSIGSINANIEEGYGRGSQKESLLSGKSRKYFFLLVIT